MDIKAQVKPDDNEEKAPTVEAEAKTRNLIGWVSVVFAISAVMFSIYHFIVAGFSPIMALKHRSIHVSGVLFLIFLLYPMFKKNVKKGIPFYDIILALLSLACGIYTVSMIDVIALRGGSYTTLDVIVGFILLLLILEATRRTIGNILVFLSLIFVSYALFGQHLPGIFMHAGFSVERIVTHLYITTEGILGITTGVSATYVFLFVLFGSIMIKSGMGEFFNNIAMAIAGRRHGGPAKVAVLGSGLLGSINGSAASNVATTGAFTIPLMKRIGYSPTFAGAVESVASTGGQILPPVMGAGAFIMAEFLGISYLTIAAAALFPALLFYFCVWVAIDLRAKKSNLKRLSKDELPNFVYVIKEQGHLSVPLILIIFLLVLGYTPLYAASRAIIAAIIISLLRKATRLGPKKIFQALVDGAKMSLGVAIACIAVGFVVGIISLTGLGTRLGSAILSLSSGELWLTLILVMILSIIMGMGLPTSAAYIVAATVAAPALINLGVDPLSAHLFVFYFAMLAGITPPVAITSYIGAAIAYSDPNKTAFMSVKLALAGFIVPFMFIYSPTLLFLEGTIMDKILGALTAIIGIIALASSLEGYLLSHMNKLERLLAIIAALSLIKPGIYTDLAGVSILLIICFIQLKKTKSTQLEKEMNLR